MPGFDDFIDTLNDDLIELGEQFGENIKDDLVADGEAFVNETKEDLEEWTKQVANGKLSQDELEWLLRAKKDLAEMEALKQKGIAEAKIDKLRGAVIETVAGSVFKVLK